MSADRGKTTVLDIGVSNLGSLIRAFHRIGRDVEVTSDPATVERASTIFIPGVGSFAAGIGALRSSGIDEIVIAKAMDAATPVIGVCLGFQLLTDGSSENGRHEGLGLIPGWTERLPEDEDAAIPNFGWCDVEVVDSSVIPSEFHGESLYFAHSFSVVCEEAQDVAMRIQFGARSITAAAGRGSAFGFQFHPELSQNAGLDCLAAVMTWADAQASVRPEHER